VPTVRVESTEGPELVIIKKIRNVMGIDPSLNATGVCLPDERLFTITCESEWGDRRLGRIRDVIRTYAPGVDLAVIEDKVHASFSASVLGMVQGVIRLELMDQGIPYVLVSAKTLKKYATDNGNADKKLMIAAARRRAGLIIKDDNQCDAWWLRTAGCDWFDLPTRLRTEQEDYFAPLKKVKWPMTVEPAIP
jgi:hypothetical protein